MQTETPTNLPDIHSFWISGPLKPLNLLTIRSFQAMGHRFILYAYDVSCTNECEVRDARLIMPEREIFYYKQMLGGNPNFKFGGIAERLKAEMLYKIGGWHVDLDVTCLRPFNFTAEYVLRPHNTHAVVGNIIRAPRYSELARLYVQHTKTIDADNRIWEKSFLGLNEIVTQLNLQPYILPEQTLGNDAEKYWKAFLKAGSIFPEELMAVHWCNAMQLPCEPGSALDNLFTLYGLN